jgi:RNA polymerase sigma-70 factor (ECF subfamily)
LAQLPIEFRTPVVLRDLCTLDYAEIAAVLDIPPGTVRSRIARGRAQLADILRIPFEGEREPDLPFRRPTVEP